jgi:hypothetical protein
MHIENINNAFIELNNLNYHDYFLHFTFLFLKVIENTFEFEFNFEENRLNIMRLDNNLINNYIEYDRFIFYIQYNYLLELDEEKRINNNRINNLINVLNNNLINNNRNNIENELEECKINENNLNEYLYLLKTYTNTKDKIDELFNNICMIKKFL